MIAMKEPRDLLPLRRMAARLGVPSKWLKEQAESGKVPGLKAGDRWLFVPDVAAVRALAESSVDVALELMSLRPEAKSTIYVRGSMSHPFVQWMKDKGFDVVNAGDHGADDPSKADSIELDDAAEEGGES